MAARTITLELPEGLLELLGPPDAIAGKVRETLVLDLLREAQITRGRPRDCSTSRATTFSISWRAMPYPPDRRQPRRPNETSKRRDRACG